MRRIISIIAFVIFITILCSCGNMGLGVGNYSFTHVHVDTHHHSGCYEVIKWHDATSGIEVDTKEVGSMFLSEGIYIMLESKADCPFCNKGE